MKTFSAKPDAVRRDWYVVDAAGKTLGRLASWPGACAASTNPNTRRTWTQAITSS